MLEKIISGGQTGADQGGLEAGKQLGIETGGTAPLGWKTENGREMELLKSYNLVECSIPGYSARTRLNILNSDGTVVFGNVNSVGSRFTCDLCIKLQKPWIVNPKIIDLLEFLNWHDIRTLNVAGNRESRSPGIQVRVRNFLIEAIKELTDE